ncbi:MAG: hypothetical protein RIR76_2592 [Verrucomicrobiota bacterium]
MVIVKRNDTTEFFHHGDTEAPRTGGSWKSGTHGSGAIRSEKSSGGTTEDSESAGGWRLPPLAVQS